MVLPSISSARMSGPIYNAVRHSQAGSSTGVHQVSPTASAFSGSTLNTLSKADLRDATRHRKGFAIFTSFMFFVTMVMLILVQIGNLSNMKVIQDLWFFKIDVSKVLPSSAPGGAKGAKAIGLHDFYQVGLWNFCEGYNDKGITACSKPTIFYWFNPVQILLDELLDGATGKPFPPSSSTTSLPNLRLTSLAPPSPTPGRSRRLLEHDHDRLARHVPRLLRHHFLVFCLHLPLPAGRLLETLLHPHRPLRPAVRPLHRHRHLYIGRHVDHLPQYHPPVRGRLEHHSRSWHEDVGPNLHCWRRGIVGGVRAGRSDVLRDESQGYQDGAEGGQAPAHGEECGACGGEPRVEEEVVGECEQLNG